jgi:hypothetical protein
MTTTWQVSLGVDFFTRFPWELLPLKLNLQSRTEAATSGHRTLQKVQKYTEAVDRKKLADKAIRKRIANNQVSNLDVH